MNALGYTSFVLWITIPSTPVDSTHVARLLAQLRQIESPTAAEALREARDDPAASVRHTAAWALEQLDLD